MEKLPFKAFAIQSSDGRNIILVGHELSDCVDCVSKETYSNIVSINTINAELYVVGYSDTLI